MPVLRTNQEKAERLKLFFQKFQNQLQSRGWLLLAYNTEIDASFNLIKI